MPRDLAFIRRLMSLLIRMTILSGSAVRMESASARILLSALSLMNAASTRADRGSTALRNSLPLPWPREMPSTKGPTSASLSSRLMNSLAWKFMRSFPFLNSSSSSSTVTGITTSLSSKLSMQL